MSLQRKRYWLLLTYVLLALPLVGYGARRALDTNANSPLDWVPSSFPARRDYDAFRSAFGDGDVVVISWPGCTLDQPNLDGFARGLRRARAFYDEQGNWYFQRVTIGREVFQRLRAAPLSLSRNEAVHRLRGTLVGPDGRSTCAIVTFTAAGLKCRRRLVALIRDAAHRYCQIPRDDLHLAGPVIDGLSVDVASKQSLNQLATPAALIVLYVCWKCLRSAWAAMLVFGLSVLAQGATLALVYYCGDTMSALLIVMPPLIQVLAVAGGIHLVNYYVDASRDPGVGNPAGRALQMGWLPCVLSAGTTAVGLGSLMVSRLTPIRLFGAYASAGVLITTGLLLALVPGTLSIWPWKIAPSPSKGRTGPLPSRDNVLWQRLTDGLSRVHGLVVVTAVLAMAGAAWGIPRIHSSVRIETLFSADSRILRDYAWLEQHIGPLVPIEVVLQYDPGCRLPLPERIALAERVKRRLAKLDAVGGTMSPVTLLPDFPSRPDGPPTDYRRRMAAALQASRAQLVDAGYLRVTGDGVWLRVTAYVSALDDMDYGQFLDVVRGVVQPILRDQDGNPRHGVKARLTGIMPLVHEIQHQLMSDLLKSFLAAFGVIAVVMTLVQGGIVTGLVSMVPNIFPSLLLFGTLGWLEWPVDIGSVMTASVALGIAVDDTLHFLTFFRRGIDSAMAPRSAVRYAYGHCAAAMVQTSVTCGLGLSVFALSDFLPTSRFAWMMVVLLFAALLGDLVLLPALLVGPLGKWFCPPSNGSAPPRSSVPGRIRGPHRAARRRADAAAAE